MDSDDGADGGSQPPTTPILEVEEELDFGDLETGGSDVLAVSQGTFALSIFGRSKRRTLHRVGSCYRIPGV